MKNYRVGYVTGGVVREIRKGAKRLGEAAKKPGLKDLEKLKKGREGREAPKVKPDPRAPSRPKKTWPPKHKDFMRRFPKRNPHRDVADIIKDRTVPDPRRKPNEKSEYIPLKKGGKADKNWIQKATASIKKRGTEGKCTPITKKGCTGRAKALAKTFKKMAKKRKAA